MTTLNNAPPIPITVIFSLTLLLSTNTTHNADTKTINKNRKNIIKKYFVIKFSLLYI